jgi:hypothetical protein
MAMGALLGWTLVLSAGCSNPGNECQAGSPEVLGNGLDDDCDGLTDECSLDADCQDSDPCTQDLCQGGQCKNPAVEEGTSCDDGDRCTAADACRAGLCQGKPRD